MDKNFWPTNMPGSELETVSIDLETGAEQSLQMELFQEEELAG